MNFMKLPILLTALLLSAKPALADDLINLKCNVIVTQTIKHATTKQILEDEESTEVVYLKVDTINSRIVIDNSPNFDLTFANGVATDQINDYHDGSTVRSKFYLEFSPPGKIDSEFIMSDNDVLARTAIKGKCQIIDRVKYEEVMNQ